VLKRNPYRRFYQKLGGRILGEETIEIGGVPFQELVYGWEGLRSAGHL
jgi:hypothetical protein